MCSDQGPWWLLYRFSHWLEIERGSHRESSKRNLTVPMNNWEKMIWSPPPLETNNIWWVIETTLTCWTLSSLDTYPNDIISFAISTSKSMLLAHVVLYIYWMVFLNVLKNSVEICPRLMQKISNQTSFLEVIHCIYLFILIVGIDYKKIIKKFKKKMMDRRMMHPTRCQWFKILEFSNKKLVSWSQQFFAVDHEDK